MASELSTLVDTINKRLTDGLAALNDPAKLLTSEIVVLTEDAKDLETEINKAIAQIGMLVLIGEPHYVNGSPTSKQSGVNVSIAVAIGETPTIWRDAAGLKPKCRDVSIFVNKLLAQYPVPGFLPLRVLKNDFFPDKKRNLRELSIEAITTLNPIS